MEWVNDYGFAWCLPWLHPLSFFTVFQGIIGPLWISRRLANDLKLSKKWSLFIGSILELWWSKKTKCIPLWVSQINSSQFGSSFWLLLKCWRWFAHGIFVSAVYLFRCKREKCKFRWMRETSSMNHAIFVKRKELLQSFQLFIWLERIPLIQSSSRNHMLYNVIDSISKVLNNESIFARALSRPSSSKTFI